MKGKRTHTRARDSRGRPVRGIYVRDSHYFAGWMQEGRWSLKQLEATTISEARRERESLLAGLREGRLASRNGTTFHQCYEEWRDTRRIAARTCGHEEHLIARHLDSLVNRPVQSIDSREVARHVRDLRSRYSEWTVVAVLRILRGTFDYAVRHKIIVANPCDALAGHEKPRQTNAKEIRVCSGAELERLIEVTATDRWRCAVALAAFEALRLGELRALRWQDVDFEQELIHVHRALLPSGEEKPTKTRAGIRSVTLFPGVRRRLASWKLASPYAMPTDFVISTGAGGSVAERNLRRTLAATVEASGLEVGEEERLSWHTLRHSAGSVWLTELGLAITTVSEMLGHSSPAFTLRCYGHESRDQAAIVTDVLARAAAAGIGV